MITDMEQQDNYRVRRFTERECFRLMGVGESDIDKIQAAGISPTRQKSLAGNSIVVDVLTEIFRTMLDSDSPEYDKPQQLTLF
jgi:site-specific DNA-cytosine methylase